jgi:hypothetical protein
VTAADVRQTKTDCVRDDLRHDRVGIASTDIESDEHRQP